MTTAPKFDTVMVIDDNNIDLYVTARTMTKNNFCNNLLQYSSAADAIKYLKSNAEDATAWPQVILVDIYMPVMSGFEFMEAFEKLPEILKKNTLVYIVSSTIDEHDIARALNDENVIDFQEKPLSSEFLEKINPVEVAK